MNKKKLDFKDYLLIALMIVPFIIGMVIKVLTEPASEGMSVSGSHIYFTIPMPFQDLPITESQLVSLIVVLSTLGLCLFLTRHLKVRPDSKRQLIAEFIVEKAQGLVMDNMGARFRGFTPFIGAIIVLSALSSLSSLLGLHPPTSDLNIIAGWAILVFILITYYKLKGGLLNYMKGFTEPVIFFTPMNIVSEIATPVAMSFRHYGNVLSGVVIGTMVSVGLSGLSNLLLGWLTGIPILSIGLPAILSLYFDLFSGCLQAYIFAMLTMLYIANGFPEEAYEARKAKKAGKAA